MLKIITALILGIAIGMITGSVFVTGKYEDEIMGIDKGENND